MDSHERPLIHKKTLIHNFLQIEVQFIREKDSDSGTPVIRVKYGVDFTGVGLKVG